MARDHKRQTWQWPARAVVSCLSLGIFLNVLAAQSGVRPRPKANRKAVQASNAQQSTTSDGFDSSPIEAPEPSSRDVVEFPLPDHISEKHPLVPALKMAYASRATLANVNDYTAQFVKKELVGQQYITHNMDMKFRKQPFGVYLRFREPHEGRQVLYVKGANNGNILVREAGLKSLAGTIAIEPTNPLALSENRHPITDIGIANMLQSVITQWEEEARYGEIDVGYYPNAKLGDYPVRVIVTTHPARRKQFKFHKTQLFLDEKTLFPVRVDRHDWPATPGGKPVPVELYMYSRVKTNQNLSNADFDPRAYGLR